MEREIDTGGNGPNVAGWLAVGVIVIVVITLIIALASVTGVSGDPDATIVNDQGYTVTVGDQTFDAGCAGDGLRLFTQSYSHPQFFVIADPNCKEPER